MRHLPRIATLLTTVVFLGITGCAGYDPPPMEQRNQNFDRTATTVSGSDEGTELSAESERDSSNRQEELKTLESRQDIQIEDSENSTLITVRAKVLFDLRSAKVKRTAMPTLDEIAKFLAKYPNHWVMVGGHTDALPTRTDRFPSNWELSAIRAVNVVKYLSRMKGLDSSRLIASGFGDKHPIASNRTEEGRQLNRRVEIYLIRGGFPVTGGNR